MKQRLPDLGVGCEGEHSNITLGVTPCVTLTRWCNALHSVLHSSQQCNGECNAGECNRATIVNKSIVINRNHEIITHSSFRILVQTQLYIELAHEYSDLRHFKQYKHACTALAGISCDITMH